MQTQKYVIGDGEFVSRCRAVTKPGSYSILPRANRVMHTLPVLEGGEAQVLAAPPLSSYYVAHEVLLEPGGGTTGPIEGPFEHFLYVLEGEMEVSFDRDGQQVVEGGYCWLPPDRTIRFRNPGDAEARVFWLRRRYQPLPGVAVPEPIVAHESEVTPFPEPVFTTQQLIPYDDPAFDMGCNLLTYEPGRYFAWVESHVMEHALYMVAGRAVYWLNGDYIEVQRDDFIHMAAFCPQFVYATGTEPMRYLVYKDVNRDYDWTLPS